jgi:tubulin monoglycylase TTLL15
MATNKSAAATMRKRLDQAKKIDANDPAEVSLTKVFVIVFAVAALLVGLYIQLAKNINERLKKSADLASPLNPEPTQTPFQYAGQTLVVADNMDAGYLDHIIDALLKFGHNLSFSGSITPQKAKDGLEHFNLIWTHDYPFSAIKNLRPHQRMNHFPGTGFITNKMTLSTTPNLPHVLKAFRMPLDKDRFLSYARQHPEKRNWIQKSSSHRGISIETTESVNLDLNDTLIQEYMSNPLLVDGKKFDIGIYVVLTSVDPLRVYVYESESLLRFCAHPYIDPTTGSFNESDIDSYVVGDDYTPIWLVPSLLRYYIGTNLSMKQTLNAYLKRLNKDGQQIWKQIDDTIKSVYKSKEHHLARMTRMYQAANNYNDTSVEGSLNQFFEMVRFDFIVDENLNVYLMEANMSPNLSSRHFPPNRLLYEQVLNSYFSLVGLDLFARQHLSSSLLPVHYLDGRVELPKDSVKSGLNKYGLDGLISEKELSVYEELCVSDECHMNCQKLDCKVCYFCLNNNDKLHIRRAIYEQYSRWNFKRLLPSTRDEDLQLQMQHPDRLGSDRSNNPQELIDSNYIHVQWFRGKCFSDQRFCSY